MQRSRVSLTMHAPQLWIAPYLAMQFYKLLSAKVDLNALTRAWLRFEGALLSALIGIASCGGTAFDHLPDGYVSIHA